MTSAPEGQPRKDQPREDQPRKESEPAPGTTVPEHGPHGRPQAAWTGVTIGVIVAVLLIVFIAQNTRKVQVTFLWMNGDVSEAVALLVAAVSGAAIVLLVGTIRVTQLRRAERRQRKLNVG